MWNAAKQETGENDTTKADEEDSAERARGNATLWERGNVSKGISKYGILTFKPDHC